MNIISVDNLTKSFGPDVAVDGLSFDVKRGSIFSFLGTNGAGKTTTINCITTMLKSDSGDISVDGLVVGRDDDKIRRKIGVVFQQSLLDPLLSVRENLRIRAQIYGMSSALATQRIKSLEKLIDLDFLDCPCYGKLSGGQKRRADIARALIYKPSILFLDEPTAGLDPQSREQVWKVIDMLKDQESMTVFLTTHYMEETEKSQKVCIIDAGKIIAEGTPRELRKRYSASVLSVQMNNVQKLNQMSQGQMLGQTLNDNDQIFRIKVDSADQVRSILNDLGSDVTDFEFRHGTMDDVFLALTEKRGSVYERCFCFDAKEP